MSELQKGLERLCLRLDHMGLRVEQAVASALRAVREGDAEEGRRIDEGDTVIDREEVEIEQECIRFLALYQPAAVDLRTILTIIKVNNDLERIADKASRIGRRVRRMLDEGISIRDYPDFMPLSQVALDVLSKTVRLLSVTDAEGAKDVMQSDKLIDEHYSRYIRSVLTGSRANEPEAVMTLIMLGRACERIGDLCANIAEDVVFWRTGDIIRHAGAFEEPQGAGE